MATSIDGSKLQHRLLSIRGREGMSFETEKRAGCFAVGTSDPVLVFADWFE
jgi:hypothetical protein